MTTADQGNTQGQPNQQSPARQQNQNQPAHRGFAAMDESRQREIASQGGKAAHEKGTAHEFTPEEAREAGRKGGQRSHGGQGMNQG
ncbi:MAG: general stress protein [Candidatus Protistobacter heckmanni]|nr:general stress protein [Candidatus Protistobacter heckmanni]